MHEKDFQAWHKRKAAINGAVSQPVFFYEREIWWTAIGHNIGLELDGKGQAFARPVLILRKFNRKVFLGVPLSTTPKTGKYYYHFRYHTNTPSAAILSQLRVFDTRRLLSRDGVMADEDYKYIQECLAGIITEAPPHNIIPDTRKRRGYLPPLAQG